MYMVGDGIGTNLFEYVANILIMVIWLLRGSWIWPVSLMYILHISSEYLLFSKQVLNGSGFVGKSLMRNLTLQDCTSDLVL